MRPSTWCRIAKILSRTLNVGSPTPPASIASGKARQIARRRFNGSTLFLLSIAVAHCRMFYGSFRWTQPQGDVCRLHRLLYDRQQLLAQLVQVHLLAQRRAEGCYDLGRIVLATVEAAVNNALDVTAQRLEQGIDDQRGNDQRHRLL